MGANRFAGEVEFTVSFARHEGEKETVEDKKFIFRLGTNDLIKLQDELGMTEDDDKFLAYLSHFRGMRKVRQVMKAGLLRHQPDVSDDEVGDIIDALGRKAPEVVLEAIRWMLPEPRKKGAGASGKGDGSDGLISSPTLPEPDSDQTRPMS